MKINKLNFVRRTSPHTHDRVLFENVTYRKKLGNQVKTDVSTIQYLQAKTLRIAYCLTMIRKAANLSNESILFRRFCEVLDLNDLALEEQLAIMDCFI